MSKIIVLGAGMVGRTMAIDLSKKHDVTSTDVNKNVLNSLSSYMNIKTIAADLSDSNQLATLVKNFDLVVSAVPGFLGFQTIKTIIECGKNFVDISFLPEDIRPLHSIAKKFGVTGITDMGVAPGIPNLIAGYYNEKMEISHFEYMVGGLPKVRTFPFEYKAPFSPIDVIEEYTRPARYVENKQMISKPAMSDSELLNFDHIGTLEAFNTDGLRSLIYTLNNIPNMKEKTLRYPGHIKLIKAFMETGFFNKEPIQFKEQNIIPFEFTTNLLFKKWKLQPEDPEFTVMRVMLTGKENGVATKVIYDLYDEYDPKEKLSSMARTTGFTGTAGAELILNKLFTEKGVFPPELVGKNENCFRSVIEYLKERNVVYNVTVEKQD